MSPPGIITSSFDDGTELVSQFEAVSQSLLVDPTQVIILPVNLDVKNLYRD